MIRHFVPRDLLTIGFVLALAGCAGAPASNPPQPQAANAAAAPAEAQHYMSERGDRLNADQYRALVAGNTLFRPLASGSETLVFIAADGSERMRIQTADGRVGQDAGRESEENGMPCWRWQRAGGGQPLCFEPYWNGRLLTMVDTSGQMQPAQFLIQKGNAHSL